MGHGTSGKWYHYRSNAVKWLSSIDRDPYQNIVMYDSDFDDAGLDFTTSTLADSPGYKLVTAKEIVDILCDKYGDNHIPRGLSVGIKHGLMIKEIINAELCSEPAVLDFFDKVGTLKFVGRIVEAARDNLYHEMPFAFCLDPRCGYTSLIDDGRDDLGRCLSCGSKTAANSDYLVNDGRVAYQFSKAIEYTHERFGFDHLENWMTSYLGKQYGMDLIDMFPEVLEFRLDDQFQNGVIAIKDDAPQIKVGGPHYIKGMANQQSLKDNGWGVSRGILYVGLGDLISSRRKMAIEMFSEDKIYDQSLANRFRAEYIQSRFDSEINSFEEKLRGSGVLKVKTMFTRETTMVLYNMAQRRTGRKTIIKRDGTIVFPTQEVLDAVDTSLMTKAFMATEHPGYSEPSEVFRLGKEAACD